VHKNQAWAKTGVGSGEAGYVQACLDKVGDKCSKGRHTAISRRPTSFSWNEMSSCRRPPPRSPGAPTAPTSTSTSTFILALSTSCTQISDQHQPSCQNSQHARAACMSSFAMHTTPPLHLHHLNQPTTPASPHCTTTTPPHPPQHTTTISLSSLSKQQHIYPCHLYDPNLSACMLMHLKERRRRRRQKAIAIQAPAQCNSRE
jgi:hypothetical protein